jgi:hypothetical protein
MTAHEQMQAFIRYYKREHKVTEVKMADVAKFAAKQGWKVPAPVSGIDRLAKKFGEAAREEIRYDKKTRRPYRANLCIPQLALWIDTDETDREKMVMAIGKYREQMIGEAEIGTNTVEHWNLIHPEQLPIPFPLDFADEVEWRRNAPPEEDEKAG